MIDAKTAAKVANFATALTDATRLRVLELLGKEPHSVGALAKALKVEVVNMSHHLGVLRTAGIVTAKKEGRFVYYSLSEELYADGVLSFGPVSYTLTPAKVK